jgi:hypothetical protein
LAARSNPDPILREPLEQEVLELLFDLAFVLGVSQLTRHLSARPSSAHAQVLRPRGVRRRLAKTPAAVLPSAFYDSVGTPSHGFTRLNSPACAYPYRRFAAALASGRRTARGHRGSLVLRCRAFSSPSPDRFIPALSIDKALNRGYVLLPLAAPHHRRDGPVCSRPSTRARTLGPRRRSRQHQDDL